MWGMERAVRAARSLVDSGILEFRGRQVLRQSIELIVELRISRRHEIYTSSLGVWTQSCFLPRFPSSGLGLIEDEQLCRKSLASEPRRGFQAIRLLSAAQEWEIWCLLHGGGLETSVMYLVLTSSNSNSLD